jgi:hypothetical protein
VFRFRYIINSTLHKTVNKDDDDDDDDDNNNNNNNKLIITVVVEINSWD